MPWASTVRPGLGIGALVGAARLRGFSCRALYPCLDFAGLLGVDAYEALADTPSLFALAEHVFAVDIFGKDALHSDEYLGRLGPSADRENRSTASEPFVRVRDEIVPGFLVAATERVVAEGLDIVGFSCTFNQVLPSLALARRLKQEIPSLCVLFGGASVHDAMGVAYAKAFPEWIDHVFTGEADYSFVEVLHQFQRGQPAKGIAGVTVDGELEDPAPLVTDMDLLPTPDFDDFFQERERIVDAGVRVAAVQSLPYESSRGCWWGAKHHCTFCGLNNVGMKYRSKSDEKVVDELVALSVKHGTLRFMAADNILTFSAYSGLLDRIRDLELDLDLFYEMKANVRRQDVTKLRSARVSSVQPGIESFSDHVLQLMRKGVSALQNIQLIKWLDEHDIKPIYNILVGFPGETDADFVEMIDLIEKIYHLPPPSGEASLVQVHRFAPFHSTPELFGIQGVRPAAYHQHLIPPDVMDPSEYAFFYDRDLPADSAANRHLGRLNETIRRWRASTVRTRARLGPGFVEIEAWEEGTLTTQSLPQLESMLFVLADGAVHVDRLIEALAPAWKESAVAGAIEHLAALHAAAVTSSRILSLVPFQRGRTKAELDHWLQRWTGFNPAQQLPGDYAASAEGGAGAAGDFTIAAIDRSGRRAQPPMVLPP